MAHIYVDITPDPDGWPYFKVEELDAERVGPGLYRIEGIPALVRGLARHDVVKIVRVIGDEKLWAEKVVEESGHWTVRVFPPDDADLPEVATEFEAAGCHAYATPFSLVAVDVPRDLPVPVVMAKLDEGLQSGRWGYNISTTPITRNASGDGN